MDKRYQVFVSSTYEDLQEERKAVMQALLETDCIPAGMELFPASNEDQWSLIKDVIDDSDYYILIVGGRYGSTNDEGISYTEMEYRYALETDKPIIAFVHKDPGSIPAGKTEKTDEGKQKLDAFLSLVKKKLIRQWTNPDDLNAAVTKGIIHLRKKFPAVGWVKADSVTDEKSIREIMRLKDENEKLKAKIESDKTQPPPGSESLLQGEDICRSEFTVVLRNSNLNDKHFKVNSKVTWNYLFGYLSPYLTHECSEDKMREIIETSIYIFYKEDIDNLDSGSFNKLNRFSIKSSDFQRIKIQFKALGLIRLSNANRSVKDKRSYWCLTEYGDYIMTQLIAQRKE